MVNKHKLNINEDHRTLPAGNGQEYFTILTYGCQMNEHDSERLAGQLRTIGYEATENGDQADLILINTCCVRESAEKKIYGKIGELKRLKAVNPNLIIGITGCMAQKDKEKIFKKASHVDLVLGTNHIHKLADIVKEIKQSRKPVLAVWDRTEQFAPDVPAVRRGKISAWVPIMYGCNNFCTYCIVPYVRGRESSRELAAIVEEVRQLARNGFKEVTLLGQNVNSYGKDGESRCDFADLLQAVDGVEGIERIRYMTSHPRDMSEKILNVIRDSQKVCEHFHLPIQSGSDTLLKQMNRGYTTDYYAKLVEKIRQMIPESSITTDLIIGFPGETEALFQETLDFVRTIKFDAAYTFLYSKRSGTPAATMPDQVEPSVKKERLQQLMQIQNEISLGINKKLEGKILEVLVEGPSKNDRDTLMGRTRTNKIVLWKKNGAEREGQLVPVKIDKAQTWLLKGQLLIE
jgi:tRNA-2-methylthio-N6-dimethylallyladenosine synthase